MPLYDFECKNCLTERELIVVGNVRRDEISGDRKGFWLKCNSKTCQGRLRQFFVVERFYPPALRFKDGVSQWESNEKRAKQLREGNH